MITIVNKISGFNSLRIDNPFKWLVRMDAAYRDYHAFKNAEDHRLDDMGISPAERVVTGFGSFVAPSRH